MLKLSPLVLFAYNRPQHLIQTLESLSQNQLAQHSELFIFSDAAKTEKDEAKVQKVREIALQKSWCGKVHLIENKLNKGLTPNIVEGVSQIINQFGKIIVLEDDLFLSKWFLSYMNDALNLYEKEHKVMHINGYMYPLAMTLPETFFYNVISSWGWATWARAWKHFNTDADFLLQKLQSENKLYHFDLNGTNTFAQHLSDNATKKINTWAIRWYASVYLQGGFCVNPRLSLVQNLGFDGSGENCKESTLYRIKQLAKRIAVKPIDFEEDKLVRRKMELFYKYGGTGFRKKLVYSQNKFKVGIYQLLPEFIKKFYRKLKERIFGF